MAKASFSFTYIKNEIFIDHLVSSTITTSSSVSTTTISASTAAALATMNTLASTVTGQYF